MSPPDFVETGHEADDRLKIEHMSRRAVDPSQRTRQSALPDENEGNAHGDRLFFVSRPPGANLVFLNSILRGIILAPQPFA